MGRSDFVNNLRTASRTLRLPGLSNGAVRYAHELPAGSDTGSQWFAHWLTPASVAGFERADFPEFSETTLDRLTGELEAFLEIAEQRKDHRATRNQLLKARSHLENVIAMVRKPILEDWLNAQQSMLVEVKAEANLNGWSVQEDEKEVSESLLGTYKAPRLRVKSSDVDVVFDPIARFGSDGRGVVDLVAMPTFETSHYLTFKDNKWWIAGANGPSLRHKRFTRESLVNALTAVAHR